MTLHFRCLAPIIFYAELSVKRAFLQPLPRSFVDNVFHFDGFDLRIPEREKPRHILNSRNGRLDIEAVKPLECLIADLRILGIF